MTEKVTHLYAEGQPLPDEYLHDGHIRRVLHEFGASGFQFYKAVHKRMDYQPGDIVAEVGAGMGDDGKEIAWVYRPRVVFLIEPASEDIDSRYLALGIDLSGTKVRGVEVLPSAMLSTTVSEMNNLSSSVLKGRTTYLQPVKTGAEQLGFLPDNSVSKYSAIHSIYEWQDLHAGMREAVRCMRDDAKGVIVTNGPDDKPVFRDMLNDAKGILDELSDSDEEYVTPKTRSSKINYFQAAELLSQYFEQVNIIPYRDRMIITPERAPFFIWSFNSYRKDFYPAITNEQLPHWQAARRAALLDRLEREIGQHGYLEDGIDIAAIEFSVPKK
jgi:ubiquinone/menaquinone biosynthesis C-methylase UbiE